MNPERISTTKNIATTRPRLSLKVSVLAKHATALRNSYAEIETRHQTLALSPSARAQDKVLPKLIDKQDSSTLADQAAPSSLPTKELSKKVSFSKPEQSDKSLAGSFFDTQKEVCLESEAEIKVEKQYDYLKDQPNFWKPMLMFRPEHPLLEKSHHNDMWYPPKHLKQQSFSEYKWVLELATSLRAQEDPIERLFYLKEHGLIKERPLSQQEMTILGIDICPPQNKLWTVVQDLWDQVDGRRQKIEIEDLPFVDEANLNANEPRWEKTAQVEDDENLNDLYEKIFVERAFFSRNELITYMKEKRLISPLNKKVDHIWAPHFEYSYGYLPVYKAGKLYTPKVSQYEKDTDKEDAGAKAISLSAKNGRWAGKLDIYQSKSSKPEVTMTGLMPKKSAIKSADSGGKKTNKKLRFVENGQKEMLVKMRYYPLDND